MLPNFTSLGEGVSVAERGILWRGLLVNANRFRAVLLAEATALQAIDDNGRVAFCGLLRHREVSPNTIREAIESWDTWTWKGD